MKELKEPKGKGVSIHLVHVAMIICALVLAAMMIVFTRNTSGVFNSLSQETGNYIVRQDAAHDLMEASDYLTENVQRFVLDGDTKYLDNYFEEAFVNKRREAAILTMSDSGSDETLVRQLEEAMEESMSLMYREYYAMKLVLEALDIREYPEKLQEIELKEEDAFLSAKEQMEKAKEMVMGSAYYASKDIIRSKLKADLETLNDMMNEARQNAGARMMRELSDQRTMVIVMLAALAVLIGLSAWLGTMPLMDASRSATRGEKIAETGAREFRQLARRYNEMHEQLHPPEKEDAPDELDEEDE